MSLEIEQIKQEFITLFERLAPDTIRVGNVDVVNDNDTLQVTLSDDVVISDVRLKSIISDGTGNRKVTYPTLNSKVLVGKIEGGHDYVMLACESIDKELWTIGNVNLQIDATGFTINNGTDSLKDALTLIIESVQQVLVLYGNNPDYGKLSQALEKVNNIFEA